MKKLKTVTLGLAIIAVFAFFATACTKSNANSTDKKKETVVVGTGAYPKPYTYVDDADGKLKGLDIDLLREIFKGQGAYQIKFDKTEFPSVLAGLDSDRYQIGANSFAKTPDREAKYYYSDPIYRNPLALIVPKGSNIKNLNDIGGKSTEGEPAVSYTVIIEKYNKEHPETPVKLDYTEANQIQQFRDVESGKIDFKLESEIIAKSQVKAQGLNLEVIEIPAADVKERSAFSYYIFPKTEKGKGIRDLVNASIKKLYDDGTIAKLSKSYFEGDYAINPSEKE